MTTNSSELSFNLVIENLIFSSESFYRQNRYAKLFQSRNRESYLFKSAPPEAYWTCSRVCVSVSEGFRCNPNRQKYFHKSAKHDS